MGGNFEIRAPKYLRARKYALIRQAASDIAIGVAFNVILVINTGKPLFCNRDTLVIRYRYGSMERPYDSTPPQAFGGAATRPYDSAATAPWGSSTGDNVPLDGGRADNRIV